MRTIDEYRAHLKEVNARFAEIDAEFAGQTLTDEARSEWEALKVERSETEAVIADLEERASFLDTITADPRPNQVVSAERSAAPRGGARVSDVYDLSEYRARFHEGERYVDALRDGASRVLESAVFPVERTDESRAAAHIERLLSTDKTGEFARLVIGTGSPRYQRAFAKYIVGKPLNNDEQRDLLTFSGPDGGYAVPFTLDPTVTLTSDGRVNPLRQIASVVSITTNEWRGVTSEGVVAGYGAELAVAGDDAPTLGQPTAFPEKAFAFVPYSIESGQDWGGLGSEMGLMFADARDDAEANMFLNGAGHSSQEPEGLIANLDAGSTVLTATVDVFAEEDLYALDEELPPRFASRAAFLGNRAIYNKVRQFSEDTGSGALWVRLGDGLPPQLLGYSAFEASYMSGTVDGDEQILLLGDFGRGFKIIDRVGMSVEVIPHLFDTATGRPKGQRGLYAFWRNTSVIVADNAFRLLTVKDT